ncbi:MAG: PD-(D/E)XK nuclease family protein, partial [Armatimonadota bacterium]
SSTRLYMLARDTFDSVGDSDAGFTYFHALGEENEVREVMRAQFDRDLPGDDVEILYSDGSYAPLIHSLSAQHEWPMTYADGIAVSFTRPGQAILHYLDWLSSDYDCEALTQGLQSEALNCHAREFNGRYFASPECAVVLRKAKIGWGRERYLPALDQYQSKIEFRLANQEAASETSRSSGDLDKAKVVLAWVKSLLDLSPDDSSPLTLADLAAGGLKLLDYASVAGEQDAAALTSLQQLLGEYTKLVGIDLPFLDAVDRLRSAILGLTAGRSGPREGHVHVSSIKDGGWSGRGHTFVIGLDEKRFPRAGIQGSILLDSDREAIDSNLGSQAMSLQSTRVPLEREQFRRLISSLRGNISLSYSSRDILKDQDQFPSPAMLEVFRKEKHREEADYEALRQNLGVARGFVTASAVSLDSTEGWLRSLQACHQLSGSEVSQILDHYRSLEAGRVATDRRKSESFTAYDGCVQIGGRVAFCASGQVESASALETLGACPYKYFLQYVLGVNKLQILERDPTLWLDPMDKGKLLHRVFQVFMSGITEQGMKPVFERDQDTIHRIAEDEMTRWRIKVPPPNPA